MSNLKQLAYELDGVIADVEQGDGFDSVCLATVKRVREALARPDDKAQPVAWRVHLVQFGVWTYTEREPKPPADGNWRVEALYAAPQPPAEQPFQPDWVNYRQGFADGKAEAEQGAELSDEQKKALIRYAGGIVHSDGNIFFTNFEQFQIAADRAARGGSHGL